MPRKHHQYGEDLKPANVHEQAKVQLETCWVGGEIAGWQSYSEGGACIGKHGQHRADCSIKIQALNADNNWWKQQNCQVSEDELAHAGHNFRRHNTVIDPDWYHRARMNMLIGTAKNHFDHHRKSYNLDWARGGCAAAANEHKGEETQLAGGRP